MERIVSDAMLKIQSLPLPKIRFWKKLCTVVVVVSSAAIFFSSYLVGYHSFTWNNGKPEVDVENAMRALWLAVIAVLLVLEDIYDYYTTKDDVVLSQSEFNLNYGRNNGNEDGYAERGNEKIDDIADAEVDCNKVGIRSIGKLIVSSKEIGKGSNGTIVFEGMYEGRNIAVKRLFMTHLNLASTEAQILTASDQHQNIVRFYGRESDNDFVYLALEHCDGTLYDLIQNKIMYFESFPLLRPNGYPSSILLKLMRDIVDGLVHLHELRIIHGDLKPHNVLIVKLGKGLCAKLADMGISRRLVGNASSLGPNATVSGSLGWRAPEQICHGRQTPALDLFSLGDVLFFGMTAGKHPFGDHPERDINVIDNKLNLSLVKHIPEALDLFFRLLNPNPELRPKASEVQHHPLFWSSKTRMSFLRETSDRIELQDCKVGSIVKELERKGKVAFGKQWDNKMEPAFISARARHRHYKYDRVRDLLRIIRNTLNHYQELPEEIQELLGSFPEGVDDYFRSRFPKLLMKVYNVMCHHCNQEEWFREYLEN